MDNVKPYFGTPEVFTRYSPCCKEPWLRISDRVYQCSLCGKIYTPQTSIADQTPDDAYFYMAPHPVRALSQRDKMIVKKALSVHAQQGKAPSYLTPSKLPGIPIVPTRDPYTVYRRPRTWDPIKRRRYKTKKEKSPLTYRNKFWLRLKSLPGAALRHTFTTLPLMMLLGPIGLDMGISVNKEYFQELANREKQLIKERDRAKQTNNIKAIRYYDNMLHKIKRRKIELDQQKGQESVFFGPKKTKFFTDPQGQKIPAKA